jgi:hypothetical protein
LGHAPVRSATRGSAFQEKESIHTVQTQPAQRHIKKVETFRAQPFKRTEKWISPHPNPYVQPRIKKTGTLVILWTRDFRAHSEMVSNKF